MTNEEILSHVDHTLLEATAGREAIRELCRQALEHGTASVCIPPSYVAPVHAEFGSGLVICTVVGFPLGYVPAEAKVLETELAVKAGAGEIDMVIDQGDVKNGDFAAVEREIRAVRAACSGKVLKVIIETCNLTPEEKVRLCKVVGDSGADYIKTSTGFGSSGACLADIALFKEHLPPGVRIKAAGGIRSREDLEAFIRAGADRLGTSSAVKLLAGTADSGKAGQY